MTKFRCPFIGVEIEEFTIGSGLNKEIYKVVCGNREKTHKDKDISCSDEDGKPECEGLALMGIVENQIAHEGIKFMKGLVKAWGEVKDE